MNKTPLFDIEQKEQQCPNCSAPLVVRSGKSGPFLGCSLYPDCDYFRSLKKQTESRILTVLEGQNCPYCQSTLVLRQGRYGMFIGCISYPDCSYRTLIDAPDVTASELQCPLCRQGQLVQRHSRFGKTFYACDRYPTCQFATNFTPIEGKCAFCDFPLLIEKKTSKGFVHCCANKTCSKVVKLVEKELSNG